MNIYFGNLNYQVQENELQQLVEEFGQVNSCKIIIDRITRRSKGFGFVEMADENAGRKVIEELNGKEFEGRQLVVKEAIPRD